jgi:hypothetical protein
MPTSEYNVNILISAKDRTGTATKRASNDLGGLAKAAKFAAGAFAAVKTAQGALDFLKFGTEVQRASRSLDNLAKSAGTSGQEITRSIQKASDHTIDRMSAMESANRALLMGVADTPEEFARITNVAVKLGRAMGVDATKSIDDFVTASGRQSKMIADNLGLMISMEDVQTEANRLMAENADLTESAAKKQAFLNVMLTEGEAKTAGLNDETEDAAIKLERMNAQLADLKANAALATAEIVSESGAMDWLNVRLAMLPDTLERIGMLTKAFGNALNSSGSISENFTGQLRAQTITTYGLAESNEVLRYKHTQQLEQQYLIADALGNSQIAFNQYDEAINASIAVQDEAYQSAVDLRLATEEQALAQLDLNTKLKDATEAQIASVAISELKQAFDEGTISFDEYSTAVGEVQLTFGLADEQSIKLTEGILDLTERLADGTIKASDYDDELVILTQTAEGAAAQVALFGDEINKLPSQKTVRIGVEFYQSGSMPSGHQHGGPASGMTLVGEGGPELVRLPPGSHVFSNSQSSNITNYHFNQTVNTRATSGTVRQDYAMMRALVGAA